MIGTDVSPIQSPWVPPNLKLYVLPFLKPHCPPAFRTSLIDPGSEIEDCTLDWTFEHGSVDYVHIRFLLGSIPDWEAVFKQAFQTLAPGGWLESHEGSGRFESDDGTVCDGSALHQWGRILHCFGESIGRPFDIIPSGIQRKAMEAAGFVDIREAEYKVRLRKPYGFYIATVSLFLSRVRLTWSYRAPLDNGPRTRSRRRWDNICSSPWKLIWRVMCYTQRLVSAGRVTR